MPITGIRQLAIPLSPQSGANLLPLIEDSCSTDPMKIVLFKTK